MISIPPAVREIVPFYKEVHKTKQYFPIEVWRYCLLEVLSYKTMLDEFISFVKRRRRKFDEIIGLGSGTARWEYYLAKNLGVKRLTLYDLGYRRVVDIDKGGIRLKLVPKDLKLHLEEFEPNDKVLYVSFGLSYYIKGEMIRWLSKFKREGSVLVEFVRNDTSLARRFLEMETVFKGVKVEGVSLDEITSVIPEDRSIVHTSPIGVEVGIFPSWCS